MPTLEAVDNFASGALDIAGRLPRRAFRLVRLSFRLGLFVAGQSPRRVFDGAFGLLRRALHMFRVHLEFLLVVRKTAVKRQSNAMVTWRLRVAAARPHSAQASTPPIQKLCLARCGLTTGFTGADLANLVNEVATVTAAIERIVAGLEK
jgi:hypothetical protein